METGVEAQVEELQELNKNRDKYLKNVQNIRVQKMK